MTRIDNSATEAITELLMGRRVTAVEQFEATSYDSALPLGAEGCLTLDDGTQIYVVPNEGCGGCSAGHYNLSHLAAVDNIITRVTIEATPTPPYNEEIRYTIFVYTAHEQINLLQVEGDDGNGWYGTGYELVVVPAPVTA